MRVARLSDTMLPFARRADLPEEPGARSRCTVWTGRHRELKDGAAGRVCGRPQSSAMSFDDRTTDRQPHPQTAALGRIEGLKEVLVICWRQSRPRILHSDEHAVLPVLSRANQQPSRSLADAAHCFNGVDDQVEDHLLQLDPISLNERQALRELRLRRDAVLHHFPTGQDNHIADRVVDVQAILPWRRLLDEVTDPADAVASSICVLGDAAERLPDLLQIRWLNAQPP